MKVDLNTLVHLINEEIEGWEVGRHPVELYGPIRYVMSMGGKRMRPLLTLLAYSLFKSDVQNIIKPALAVEVFHNFTLVHDDIMDQAPLRRGKATVHEKWNHDIAILSGDVMFIKAYELLLYVSQDKLGKVINKFSLCATQVCEGQQLDMNFENRDKVPELEYLEMVRLKTAVLLGFSLELGAILGGADDRTATLLKDFGINIGIGFQLKDDLLDVYADQHIFGKQVGGDIIANKKTFLLIKAMENANGENEERLSTWLNKEKYNHREKVEAVTGIYNELNVKNLAEHKMNEYFYAGFSALDKLEVPEDRKLQLRSFAEKLINRES